MWICSQIGAREHYAVPRALQKSNRLAALYVDFWAGPAVRQLAIGKSRPLAARFHPELGQAEIVSWNLRALWWEGMLRKSQRSKVRSQKSETRGPYHGFIEVGSRFAIRVRESLKRRTDLKPGSIFFAYDTGALETMDWCREKGIQCILNQMDPNRTEAELVRAEEKQWPGWAAQPMAVPEEYFQRREREWALADRIVVNSEFSHQALLRQGVAAEKLAVVPLCFERAAGDGRWKMEDGNQRSEVRGQKAEIENQSGNEFQISDFSVSAFSPLRVLFLGQVILRKGIQYLIEAAKLLSKEKIHFDVVGPVGISREAVASAPGNMTFHGRAGRDQAADWYRRSHLFVLPTISDGFAITQLEAMAHALPVIATPCCGEVVSDGADGFIVPPRDAGALARTFRRYLAEPDLLKAQRKAALEKSGQFTLERLAENLLNLEVALEDDR
jgi:glycosyltransferase involved in cell wall biosynthesis